MRLKVLRPHSPVERDFYVVAHGGLTDLRTEMPAEWEFTRGHVLMATDLRAEAETRIARDSHARQVVANRYLGFRQPCFL